MNHVQGESGFSLLEIILSIALLAFISVYILQMFIVPARANERARDIDIGTTIACSAIEILKNCSTADTYRNDAFFHGSFSDVSDNGQEQYIYMYYDQDWHPLASDTGSLSVRPTESRYLLTVTINRNGAAGEDTYIRFSTDGDTQTANGTGYLCTIQALMQDVAVDDQPEIVSLQASKYISSLGIVNTAVPLRS